MAHKENSLKVILFSEILLPWLFQTVFQWLHQAFELVARKQLSSL